MGLIMVTMFGSLIMGGVVGAMYGGILGYFLLVVNTFLVLDLIVTGSYHAGKKKMADETIQHIKEIGAKQAAEAGTNQEAYKHGPKFSYEASAEKIDWDAFNNRSRYENSLARSILNKDISKEDDGK